jgi:hypothetical protein
MTNSEKRKSTTGEKVYFVAGLMLGTILSFVVIGTFANIVAVFN